MGYPNLHRIRKDPNQTLTDIYKPNGADILNPKNPKLE